MTIKISQLGALTTVQGNVLIPVVSNITGTFTTVQANVQQIGQYITSGVFTYGGNLVPSANVTYSLGSLTNQWKDLYLSGSTIYLGNTTIKASGGGITVAPAPNILFDKAITTNNVVPGNIQITGQANGAGTMSATLTFLAGDATYHTLSLNYGTDYVINPWVNNLGNLQILLTNTYLNSQGWLGNANIRITETGLTSATLSNVGVTTGNIATPAGNLTITGNVSITGNITSPTITNLSASIVAANVGMKGYVDAATSGENTAITAANVGMKGYVDFANTIQAGAITAANVGMKGYVDFANTIQAGAITAANVGIIGYVGQQVTTANVGMKGYVDNQTYSNVKVSQYLPTYTGNVGALGIVGGAAIYGALNVGFPSPLQFGNVVVNAVNTANSYVQLNIQNIDSVGTNNSADFIATAPDGTDSSKYIDMGINGNNFVSSSWTISGKDDGYLYVNTGNLTLGTDTPGTTVKVHVGGTLSANVVGTFNSNGVSIAGNVTATNYIGSGATLSALPGYAYSNVNVAAYLNTTGYNLYSNANVASYLPTYSGNVGGAIRIGGNLTITNVYVPPLANSVGTTGQITYDGSYVYICIAANTWKRANLAVW